MDPDTDVPKRKRSAFRRFRSFIERHRIVALVICGAILLLIGGGLTYLLAYQAPTPTVATTFIKPKPKPASALYSPLTGVKVADAATTKQPVTGVMIENSPDARPQSGLKQGGIIYEAIAEGGITRFLVLYQEAKPQLIGPVRSVREYDADWLLPYNAGLAHVGGSAAALSMIRSGGNWRDLDQFFNSGYYWRSTDRYAPHNVYTSFAKLDALNQAKGYTTSQFTGFKRTDGKPAATKDATHIAINFSGALYNTVYDYNTDCNCYGRSQAGAPHLDREDGQITPSVVIALHVQETTIMQDGARESIQTSGNGKATIFQNGTAIEATWHKANQQAPLGFTDAKGQSIALVRGQTWIAAVPDGEGSASWQ